jgi:hypothetical protein
VRPLNAADPQHSKLRLACWMTGCGPAPGRTGLAPSRTGLARAGRRHTGFVTAGEPSGWHVGVAWWATGTAVDGGATAVGSKALRGVRCPAGGAVTTGGVAAGTGRGAAGAFA